MQNARGTRDLNPGLAAILDLNVAVKRTELLKSCTYGEVKHLVSAHKLFFSASTHNFE